MCLETCSRFSSNLPHNTGKTFFWDWTNRVDSRPHQTDFIVCFHIITVSTRSNNDGICESIFRMTFFEHSVINLKTNTNSRYTSHQPVLDCGSDRRTWEKEIQNRFNIGFDSFTILMNINGYNCKLLLPTERYQSSYIDLSMRLLLFYVLRQSRRQKCLSQNRMSRGELRVDHRNLRIVDTNVSISQEWAGHWVGHGCNSSPSSIGENST